MASQMTSLLSCGVPFLGSSPNLSLLLRSVERLRNMQKIHNQIQMPTKYDYIAYTAISTGLHH